MSNKLVYIRYGEMLPVLDSWATKDSQRKKSKQQQQQKHKRIKRNMLSKFRDKFLIGLLFNWFLFNLSKKFKHVTYYPMDKLNSYSFLLSSLLLFLHLFTPISMSMVISLTPPLHLTFYKSNVPRPSELWSSRQCTFHQSLPFSSALSEIPCPQQSINWWESAVLSFLLITGWSHLCLQTLEEMVCWKALFWDSRGFD